MADRLTQLQLCLDQMMEQFCATLNYVDKNHDFAIASPTEQQLIDKHATVAPKEEFNNTIEELSTDIILKTRQIMKLIDSLPGVDVSEREQMLKIDSLQRKLVQVEKDKLEATKKKDILLQDVDNLISMFVNGIANSRNN